MANRRCLQSLTRYFQCLKTLNPISRTLAPASISALRQTPNPKPINHIFHNFSGDPHCVPSRHFSSRYTDGDGDNDDDEGDGSEEEDEEIESQNEKAVLSAEDKVKEAAEIGYTVIGPIQDSDRVFKPYEPVFAVVQVGSHQFKVSNGDSIYTERLKFCDVNDKKGFGMETLIASDPNLYQSLILNKVLMLGSKTQTIIGRPILPDAAVHTVVEEHALDAKVIVFKKKRRKNYRRTKGHRQELTKLRITDIQGVEKPEKVTSSKTEKKEKLGKLAVEA